MRPDTEEDIARAERLHCSDHLKSVHEAFNALARSNDATRVNC